MCDYLNCNKPGEYLLGVSKAKSKKPERILESICLDHMRKSIDIIMGQAFSTMFWVAIFDLNENLLYHSFEAGLQGYTATAGWELYLEEKSHKTIKLNIMANYD